MLGGEGRGERGKGGMGKLFCLSQLNKNRDKCKQDKTRHDMT